MRDNWMQNAVVELSPEVICAMMQPISAARVEDARLVSGGLANTTYRVGLHGLGAFAVRVFTREAAAAEREHRLALKLPQSALMPRVLHLEPAGLLPYPYVISEWRPGETLAKSPDRGRAMAQSIGRCLAAIHSVPFAATGFLNAALDVAQPVQFDVKGLLDYMRSCFGSGVGRERLTAQAADRLLFQLERCATNIEAATSASPCLVHGDFGGSNLLVQATSGSGRIEAVLDWEFAFSGNPLFDFGNLLRSPIGDDPEFAAGLADGYIAAGGGLPDDWLLLSRVMDLYSWGRFLSMPESGDALIADARRTVERTTARLEAEW